MDPYPQFWDPDVDGDQRNPELVGFKRKLQKLSAYRDENYMGAYNFIVEYLTDDLTDYTNSEVESTVEDDRGRIDRSGDNMEDEKGDLDEATSGDENSEKDQESDAPTESRYEKPPGLDFHCVVTNDDPFDRPMSSTPLYQNSQNQSSQNSNQDSQRSQQLDSQRSEKDIKRSKERLPMEERQRKIFDLLWKELQVRAEGREYCNWDDDLDDDAIDEREANMKEKSTEQIRVILALADDCFEYVHSVWRLLWIVSDDEEVTCIPALWNRWKSRVAVDVNAIHGSDIVHAQQENEDWAKWQGEAWAKWQEECNAKEGAAEGTTEEREAPAQEEPGISNMAKPMAKEQNIQEESLDTQLILENLGLVVPNASVDDAAKVADNGAGNQQAEGIEEVANEESFGEENIANDVWSKTSVADSLKYLEKVEPELYQQMACLQERINLTFDPFSKMVGANTFDEQAELGYAALAYQTEDMYRDSDLAEGEPEDDETSSDDDTSTNSDDTENQDDNSKKAEANAGADDLMCDPKSDFLREQIKMNSERFLDWNADWGPLPTVEDMAMVTDLKRDLEPESKSNIPGKFDRTRAQRVFNRKLDAWAKDAQANGKAAFELPLVLFNHLPILENSSWDLEEFVPILEEQKRKEAALVAKEASVIADEERRKNKQKEDRKKAKIAKMKAEAVVKGEAYGEWRYHDDGDIEGAEEDRHPEERLLDRILSKKSTLDDDTHTVVNGEAVVSDNNDLSSSSDSDSDEVNVEQQQYAELNAEGEAVFRRLLGVDKNGNKIAQGKLGSGAGNGDATSSVAGVAFASGVTYHNGGVMLEKHPFDQWEDAEEQLLDLQEQAKIREDERERLAAEEKESEEKEEQDAHKSQKVAREMTVAEINPDNLNFQADRHLKGVQVSSRYSKMTGKSAHGKNLGIKADLARGIVRRREHGVKVDAKSVKKCMSQRVAGKMPWQQDYNTESGYIPPKIGSIPLTVRGTTNSVHHLELRGPLWKLKYFLSATHDTHDGELGEILEKYFDFDLDSVDISGNGDQMRQRMGRKMTLRPGDVRLTRTDRQKLNREVDNVFGVDSLNGVRSAVSSTACGANNSGAVSPADDDDEDDDLGDEDDDLGEIDEDQLGEEELSGERTKRSSHLLAGIPEEPERQEEAEEDETPADENETRAAAAKTKSFRKSTSSTKREMKKKSTSMCDMIIDAVSPTGKSQPVAKKQRKLSDSSNFDMDDLPIAGAEFDMDDLPVGGAPGTNPASNGNAASSSSGSSSSNAKPRSLKKPNSSASSSNTFVRLDDKNSNDGLSPIDLPNSPTESLAGEIQSPRNVQVVECGVSQRMRPKWQSYTFDSQNSVYPVFTPTANRWKGALLHYDGLHAFGELADFVPHVVVVEPSQYEQYVTHFPEHIFLVLDDDAQGVGYSRYIIQLFATEATLRLSHRDLGEWKNNSLKNGRSGVMAAAPNSDPEDYARIIWRSNIIWVLDDQVCRFYKSEEVEVETNVAIGTSGRLKKKKALARAKCTFREALLRVQSHPALKKMGVAGFLRENGATLCNSKMKEWNTNAFKVYKAVALNVAVLKEEKVFYIPYMRMFEDLSFLFKITSQRIATLKCQSHFYVAIHTAAGGCEIARKATDDKKKRKSASGADKRDEIINDSSDLKLMTRDRIVPDEFFNLLSFSDQEVVSSILHWVTNQEKNFMDKLADDKLIAAIHAQMEERKKK